MISPTGLYPAFSFGRRRKTMTNEELNVALYQKMSAEQERFKAWLLAQSQEEILNHAYEYAVREDIVMAMETNSLASRRAEAMLASPSPLADVFREWERKETSYMENLWETVGECAREMGQRIHAERQKAKRQSDRQGR